MNDGLTSNHIQQAMAGNEAPTLIERVIADVINYVFLGVGIGVLATLVLTAILMKIPRIRALVFPGRTPLEMGAQHYINMRQMMMDGEWTPSDADKDLMGRYFLGLSIRNAVVFLAITLLVGALATSGL